MRTALRQPDVKGKVVVAVLSGGNVDPELFHKLVGRSQKILSDLFLHRAGE
jgi:hypothetical protein